MTGPARPWRVLIVVALLLVYTAPSADAVGPPAVDERLLPAPGPVAPAEASGRVMGLLAPLRSARVPGSSSGD